MTEDINIGNEEHIDWGNTPDEDPEMGYIPRMVIIHPPNQHLQEQLELLNRVMFDSGDPQDFIFVTREELEMRKGNIVVLSLGLALVDIDRIMNETVQIGLFANSILCKINHRPVFPYYSHPKHRMKAIPTKHSLLMKLNIPRGIHRDGRAKIQNLTSSRLSRRNGSRK